MKLKKIRPETLNQLSNPHGNVQRCPSTPQEKRSTGTGEETKTPNGIKDFKGIKRKMAAKKSKQLKVKRKSSQGM
jgi:hypothetical protein